MTEARFWKGFISVLLVGVFLFVVARIWNILVPFFLGLMIAYLVHPLTDRFVAMGLRRDRVVIVFYIFLLGGSILAGLFFLPVLIREARDVIRELPTYASIFDGMIDRINTDIRSTLGKIIGKKAAGFTIPVRADHIVEIVLSKIPQNIVSFAHLGLWILIIPFVCFFGLSHGQKWLDDLFDLTPSEYVESLLGLLTEINVTLGAYMRGQLLDAMSVGFLTMLGLWFLGFNGAVLLGFITGLLNIVPFLAPVLGGSLALLFAYFQGMGPTSLFGIVCLFALVRLMDDFIFMPFIVGSVINLHPILMLLGILAGFEVGGFLGLVFAVPAMAVIKVVLSSVLVSRREDKIFQSQKVFS